MTNPRRLRWRTGWRSWTGGRLQQFMADPMSIYENPANATVGGFIGQANVLDGTVGVDCIRHGPGCARSGGTEILGVGVGLSPGTPCKAFVKHERVSLVRVQPAQVENRFAGRIVGKTSVGNSTSYGMGTGAAEF